MNDLLQGLPEDSQDIVRAYATIQTENEYIVMLSTQYALASVHQDKQKKQKCAELMVERAKLLLEATEKLASLDR